jgi:hypothetical protein
MSEFTDWYLIGTQNERIEHLRTYWPKLVERIVREAIDMSNQECQENKPERQLLPIEKAIIRSGLRQFNDTLSDKYNG